MTRLKSFFLWNNFNGDRAAMILSLNTTMYVSYGVKISNVKDQTPRCYNIFWWLKKLEWSSRYLISADPRKNINELSWRKVNFIWHRTRLIIYNINWFYSSEYIHYVSQTYILPLWCQSFIDMWVFRGQ